MINLGTQDVRKGTSRHIQLIIALRLRDSHADILRMPRSNLAGVPFGGSSFPAGSDFACLLTPAVLLTTAPLSVNCCYFASHRCV